MAQGRARDALRLLDRRLASAGSRAGSLIEIQVLRSLALSASHDEPAAFEALADAGVRAAPQGWVRVFVDEGPPMARLLGRLAAGSADGVRSGGGAAGRGRAVALLHAFEPRPMPWPASDRSAADSSSGVDPLSERELEVLALLAAGRSNREIADELFVTVDTVKKHITHILGKLSAANRTEAAARARNRGSSGISSATPDRTGA